MELKRGDYVTRASYNNDTIFKIMNIKNDIYYLKGVEVRLFADSPASDLVKVEKLEIKEEEEVEEISLDRSEYFYLPAKILHIDGDKEYLEKCLKYYKKKGILAIGRKIIEEHIYENILPLLNEYKPDIVIITGHDSFKKKGDINDLKNYRNTTNFIKAVKAARKYEKSHDKLVIIAGACQSNYEELIKAGANFASSPKRINIHALDPAIIASTLALTERDQQIDLIELLDKTKYGPDGIGGIKCNGLMYVGFPR